MQNTITVKGTGRATSSPDYVVLSMNVESTNRDYEMAMSLEAKKIENLNSTLERIGFEKKSVKTVNFKVDTDYEYIRKKDGSSEYVFRGYEVKHNLKLEFDFDSKMLTRVLSAISSCLAQPKLSIAFTVKDSTSIKEEMLRSAAENARRKAEILCDASGKKLGDLLNIDYGWSEINIYSNTRYSVADDCLDIEMSSTCKDIEIEPEDINVSDTATFVWEMI